MIRDAENFRLVWDDGLRLRLQRFAREGVPVGVKWNTNAVDSVNGQVVGEK